jgi:deoxyribonuclease IV
MTPPCCCSDHLCPLHLSPAEKVALNNGQFKIGCHVGLEKSSIVKTLHRVNEVGMTSCQIFVGNPLSYRVKSLEKERSAIIDYQERNLGRGHFFVHAPYIINLASDKKETKDKSRECLETMLKELRGVDCSVVLHTGSRGSLEDVGEQLNLLTRDPGQPPVLLENSDGAGSKLGKTYDELRRISEVVDRSFKMGFCIDTAHLFTCGENNFETPSSGESVVEFLEPYRNRLIHLNDSRTCFCSHDDNHEGLCSGCIWSRDQGSLSSLLQGALADRIPVVLETPSSMSDLQKIELYL